MIMPIEGSDPWITGFTAALFIFGFIMVLSSRVGATFGDEHSFMGYIIRQLIYTGLAWEFGVVFLSRWFDPWKEWFDKKKVQWFLVIAYTLVLLFVALRGVGDETGSRAWLEIAGMSLQPSEFGKVFLIVMMAAAGGAAGSKENKTTFLKLFAVPLTILLVSAYFVGVEQKDFGSLIITMGIGLVGLLVTTDPGLRKWQKWIVIVFVAIIIVILIGVYFTNLFTDTFRNFPLVSHIAPRIDNMKDPYVDPLNTGYQPANALYAMGDAGLFGRGLGGSVRKYGFLSQSESDYILAIVIEETGILGLALITIGYGVLLWRFAKWACLATDSYDKILLTCSMAYFMLHFFVNVGGVSTLIPMTGVPLLMISAGGSALISTGMVLGIAQNRIAHIRIQTGDYVPNSTHRFMKKLRRQARKQK